MAKRILRQIEAFDPEFDYSNLVPVIGDQVAAWCYDNRVTAMLNETGDISPWREQPIVRPPWPRFFLDIQPPRYIRGLGDEDLPMPDAFGWEVTTLPAAVAQAVMSIDPTASQWETDQDGVTVLANCYATIDKTVRLRCSMILLLSQNGDVRCPRTGEIRMLFQLLNTDPIPREVAHTVARYAAIVYAYPLIRTLQLLNCRNVSAEPREEHAHRGRRRQRRNPKNRGIRYHVLKIRGRGRNGPSGRKGAALTAQHLVGGYYRTYGEKGMFGNPTLTGTFWTEPHTRGDRRNGEVRKSYELEG